MKRLIAVVTLILCLSFPVFAGHTQGGFSCDCDPVGSICECCGNTLQAATSEEQQTTGESAPIELGALLALTLLWLKMKP